MKGVLSVLGMAAALIAPASALQAQVAPNSSASCNSGTKLSDFLSPAEAQRATHFLDDLKAAVGANDKAKVAALVKFPVRVYTMDRGYRTIANAEEFQAQYDRVFDPTVRKVVLQQVPSCMFASYRGVMVGDGEVWARNFDGTYLVSSFNRK